MYNYLKYPVDIKESYLLGINEGSYTLSYPTSLPRNTLSVLATILMILRLDTMYIGTRAGLGMFITGQSYTHKVKAGEPYSFEFCRDESCGISK